MTETGEQQVTAAPAGGASASASGVKLRGLFLKKVGMTSVYGDA